MEVLAGGGPLEGFAETDFAFGVPFAYEADEEAMGENDEFVAVGEFGAAGGDHAALVDERAEGGVEIFEHEAGAFAVEAGVMAGDGGFGKDNFVRFVAAEGEHFFFKVDVVKLGFWVGEV